MTLELIQNADDAKSPYLDIHIDDNRLWLQNGSIFRFCGEMGDKCKELKSCDWHRIRKFGANLREVYEPQSIGRFGIGFSSVYQVTDNPEIHSGEFRVRFDPELETADLEPISNFSGTVISLPYASNKDSTIRKRLRSVGVFKTDNLDKVALEIRNAASVSLYFLQNLETVRIYRKNAQIFEARIDRKKASKRVVYTKQGTDESMHEWLYLTGDFTSELSEIETKHPEPLAELNRKKQISITLSKDFHQTGNLYAYLPTKQSSGVRAHINGDFFPLPDRKSVHLTSNADKSDTYYKDDWNEGILRLAAQMFCGKFEEIYAELGVAGFWKLVQECKREAITGSNISAKIFWDALKGFLPYSNSIVDRNGKRVKPTEVVVPRGSLSEWEFQATNDLGLKCISDELLEFGSVITDVGGKYLTLDLIVQALVESNWGNHQVGEAIPESAISDKFEPLWMLINRHLKSAAELEQMVEKWPALKKLPIIVRDDLTVANTALTWRRLEAVDVDSLNRITAKLKVAHSRLIPYEHLMNALVEPSGTAIGLEIYDNIPKKFNAAENSDWIIATHTVLSYLHSARLLSTHEINAIRVLKIWPSDERTLVSAQEAKIPGNFRDSLGLTNLINPALFEKRGLDFLTDVLKVAELGIENYITDALPKLFNSEDPKVTREIFLRLFDELARNPREISTASSVKALSSMWIIPLRNGKFSRPAEASFYDSELGKIFGETFSSFVNEDWLPRDLNFREFLERWGVSSKPAIQDICLVWREMVAKPPTKESRERCFRAIRFLEANAKHYQAETFSAEIEALSHVPCLPARGVEDKWAIPRSLYLPTYGNLFESEAKGKILEAFISESNLDDEKVRSLNKFIVEYFHVKPAPEIQLVLKHASWCQRNGKTLNQDRYLKYLRNVAGEKGNKEERDYLLTQKTSNFIYFDDFGFVAPNRLFFQKTNLPTSWAVTIPSSLRQKFAVLWNLFGVTDYPSPEVLLKYLADFRARIESSTGEEKALAVEYYGICWRDLNSQAEMNQVTAMQLQRLKSENLILTKAFTFAPSSRVFVQDSEWFESNLGSKFDDFVAKFVTKDQKLAELIQIGYLSQELIAELDGVVGPKSRNIALEGKFNIKGKYFSIILSSLGDKLSWSSIFSELTVQDVSSITVNWKLDSQNIRPQSHQIENMKVFLDLSSTVLYKVRADGKLNVVEFFRNLIHQLLPRVEEERIRGVVAQLNTIYITENESEIEEYLSSMGHHVFREILAQVSDRELGDLEPVAEVPAFEIEDPDGFDANAETPENSANNSVRNLDLGVDRELLAGVALERSFAQRVSDDLGEKTPRTPTPQGADESSGLPSHGMNPNRAGVGEPSQAQNLEGRRRNQIQGGQAEIRRVWVYMDGVESTEEGQETQRERLRLEQSSIDFVLNQERLAGRSPQRFEGNNKGFDILSYEPGGGVGSSRYIEVKATGGNWGAKGVYMTHAQMLFALRRGNAFWLYVVERAGTDSPILHRIQNPVLHTAGFRFNDAWRELADMTRDGGYVDDPDELTLADCGRRFKHDVYGPGWITFVEEFENGLMAQLWYSKHDSPDKDFVKWDPEVMHKED